MLLERYLKGQLNRLPENLQVSMKGPTILQQLARLDTLVFTSLSLFYKGKPFVSQYFAFQDQTFETKQQILQIAGSLAATDRHGELNALYLAALEMGLQVREVETDKLSDGGLMGKLERTWYILGNEKVMTNETIEMGVTTKALMQQLEMAGKHVYFLAQKQPKRLLGIFACERALPSAAGEVVKEIQALGIRTVLLTGQKNPGG